MSASTDMERAPIRAPDVDGFIVAAYEAHHAEVFALLARSTRDHDLAEDLVQATFARLMRRARSGRAPGEVRGWLIRDAANLVVEGSLRRSMAMRWFGRHGRPERRGMRARSAGAGALGPDQADEMEPVLAGLSVDARLALLLSSAGLTGDEIAEAIARSAADTRTLLWRARARVRIRRDLFAEDAR